MHSHDILLAVRRVLLVAALSATGATRASAQTITFDALTGLNGQGFVSYSESGYDVDLFAEMVRSGARPTHGPERIIRGLRTRALRDEVEADLEAPEERPKKRAGKLR